MKLQNLFLEIYDQRNDNTNINSEVNQSANDSQKMLTLIKLTAIKDTND